MQSPRVFVAGVTVRLKSGGPLMTVQAEVEHLLLCVWIDETGRVHRQTFAPGELEVPSHAQLTWIRVMARLSTRRPVAATC